MIAGVTPSWNNSILAMLPNVSAEVKVTNEKFILQAGWIGYFNKILTSLWQALTPVKPAHSFFNTRVTEQYAGFKGSAGDHFYLTQKYRTCSLQIALFVNETITANRLMW